MNHTTGVANIFLELAHSKRIVLNFFFITNAVHTDSDLKTKKSCTCVVEILPRAPPAELYK